MLTVQPNISKMCDDVLSAAAVDTAKGVVCGFMLGVCLTLSAMWVIG